MILQANPVHDTIEVSRAISELGVLVVIAGLMIVIFVTAIIFIFRIIRNTNDKMLESQKRSERQTEQIITQNEVIQKILAKIADTETAESLREQTKWNAEKLLRVSFDSNLITLLKGASEILSHNHIDNKDFTDLRIKSLVNSSHIERVKWLNSFKYRGVRLGDLANSESWIEQKVEIIKKFIYSDDKNRDLLVRDLSLIYTDFNNQLEL